MPFGDEGIGSVNISDWMGAAVVASHATLAAGHFPNNRIC